MTPTKTKIRQRLRITRTERAGWGRVNPARIHIWRMKDNPYAPGLDLPTQDLRIAAAICIGVESGQHLGASQRFGHAPG